MIPYRWFSDRLLTAADRRPRVAGALMGVVLVLVFRGGRILLSLDTNSPLLAELIVIVGLFSLSAPLAIGQELSRRNQAKSP